MAKLIEESITIKVSQLVSDVQASTAQKKLDKDTVDQLVAVIQELAGDKCLVEVENNG
jgi:hypothetical protein